MPFPKKPGAKPPIGQPGRWDSGLPADPFAEGPRDDWTGVSGIAFGSYSVCFVWIGYQLATGEIIGEGRFLLNFLHGVNLVFHEFGHPAFSLFGETLGILGGTLGQLLIPLIVTVAFWRKRDTLGVAVGAWWFFENFLDVAVYMADAKYLRLQLIGGLGLEAHDWRNLFLRWNVILHATQIAGATRALGWAGLIATWAWLGKRWLETKTS